MPDDKIKNNEILKDIEKVAERNNELLWNYPYHILYARKPYTPDFIIKQGENTAYIEHFGKCWWQEKKIGMYEN